MINVNVMIDEILQGLSVKAVCQHPEEFNSMPIVSYYEIASPTGMCADNTEWAQKSYVAIDIWADSVGECGEIAIEVNRLMQSKGWYREMSRDLPPENGVRHKSMRFHKEIYFDDERND